MRIGVMLRHAGERGGIGVYTENLLTNLLDQDRENRYFLLYRTDKQPNKYSDQPNVTEHVLYTPSKLLWDQVRLPIFAERNNLDLIYNPKLSVPIPTAVKTVLVMHGAEQFVVPEAFKWWDRLYFTVANRLYCQFADAVISMTRTGAEDIVEYMGADPEKVHAIYESYNENCRVLPEDEVEDVRKKYSLPNSFVLFVGGINPNKNISNLLRAFSVLKDQIPHKLVIVGFLRWGYQSVLELIDELNLEDDVIRTGFVPEADLIGIYNMADVFVLPSLYEGFGMPVLEAMACGCPVVATERGCTPEIAGDAALLVNPERPRSIANAIDRVIRNGEIRSQLIDAGLSRVEEFSWDRTAEQTLELFRTVTE